MLGMEYEVFAELCKEMSDGLKDFTCPFLNLNKRCTIYEVRPLICKLFKCNRKAPPYKHMKLFEKEEMQLKDVRAVFFGK